MKDVLGVINVDIRDDTLGELTRPRCIASVPFGGKYRLVDFILSSMVNSGIQNVAVFPLNNYRSLMEHLGSGQEWDLHRKKNGLIILPPVYYPAANYKGDLFNFYSHQDFFNHRRQQYVLISGGNMVCNLDFTSAFKFHCREEADITLFYSDKDGLKNQILSRGLEVEEGGRVRRIEKTPGELESSKKLLGTYLLSKRFLLEIVKSRLNSDYGDLLQNGIIDNIDSLKIYAFPATGYIGVINSVLQYYRCSMDLLYSRVREELFSGKGPISTRTKDDPPVGYLNGAQVTNSLLANGCQIAGKVENSILFRGVKVHPGAQVKDSIIMRRGEIKEGARVQNAILDKEVKISRGKTVTGRSGLSVLIPKEKEI